MTRLILGTAQFGNPYGMTNKFGRLADSAVKDILSTASRHAINTIDTAAEYGDAQERLGRMAPSGVNYVTKFCLPQSGARLDADLLYRRSMKLLNVDSLAGVLMHRISDLSDPRFSVALEILRAARENGEISLLGVSVYDAEDLEFAVSQFPDLSLVQIPGNILDTRMLDHPFVTAARQTGTTIHVRSAFLQGVLLANPKDLPPFLSGLAPALERIAELAERQGSTRIGLLLRFLRDQPQVDGVIVGATTSPELREIAKEWEMATPLIEVSSLDAPASLLDPRSWQRP